MKDYIKTNQKAYNELAEEYEQSIQHYFISDRKIAEPFIDYLKNHFDKIDAMELGPGSGLNLSYFENEGFSTTAIDVSEKMIEVARKTAPKTKYIYGDFLEFDFGKLKFEGIFARAFVHLFPKKDAVIVLKKIFDLLVDNGVAFLTTTIHNKPKEGFFEKPGYKKKIKRFRKKWTEQEWAEEIIKAGFIIIDKRYNVEPDRNKKWISVLAVKIPRFNRV